MLINTVNRNVKYTVISRVTKSFWQDIYLQRAQKVAQAMSQTINLISFSGH